MDATTVPQRRALHRVQFPIAERPQWNIGHWSFPIIDLSETSCRVVGVTDFAQSADVVWAGFLKFADGEQIWIEGTIIRHDEEAIVLRLSKGVSYRKLMSLQRDFLRRYPVRHELTW